MRVRSVRTAVIVLSLGPLVFAAGCGTPDPAERGTGTAAAVRLYGTDGNMSNSFGRAFDDRPGALFRMKGTTPLTPLSGEFKSRLRTVDPQLVNFNYAGETYDAVAIAAIAAEYARATEPETVARYMVGVTTGGTVCESVADCLVLARDGRDLRYRGVSMRQGGLTDSGEPSSATYGAVSFDRSNQIDDTSTEFVGAGDGKGESAASPPAPGRTQRPVRPLRIGGLLPHTGRLAFGGPPLFAAARLAIGDINAAGGVLGEQAVWIDGDDGTSPQVALATLDRLVNEGVQVVIGAGASGITRAVLPKIIATGRVLISPTSTSDELTGIDDNGMFFRTAPPDTLQAGALADIIMRDGPRRIAIVAIDDPYGTGLQDSVQSNLVLAGVQAASIKRARYPARASYDANRDGGEIFDPIARDIKAFAPDAVLVIGSDESAFLIRSLLTQNVLSSP